MMAAVHEANAHYIHLHTVNEPYSNMDQFNNTHSQRLDSATANTKTSESDTQVQIRDTSHGRQSPYAAVSAESVATPDVTEQSNTIFNNARGVNITGNPSFQNLNLGNVYGGEPDGLESLTRFVSFDAQFDSSAQDPALRCHPGTRQHVLTRLRDWIDNPSAKERIFWLYGPAGAGKSAIAQTIAHFYATPKVAATFSFFRSDINRNDGNRLFTTLAYQLAFSIPEIRDHIAHALSEHPDLPRTDVETQFNQLLARPFQDLSDDGTQPLASAIVDIVEISKKYQDLAPIIVIDGVDECTNENLQRRFLKVIGDAVADDRFPLRFLIVSRPELQIEQAIRRFQTPILNIDLAMLDDANRDIEKYLVDEFSRIASEQGLNPTWPGQDIVQHIVYKSSGNFIFAWLVIRFVGDRDNAETQLDIVLNIKPPTTMTPFAILDQLFLEILRRVPDQVFLKKYLALLVARISASIDYGDDALLMDVSEKELHAKLRRMRSLLKFEAKIDIYHISFLDFLHDPSRSSHYYICKQHGIRGYLEVFVDSLVRYASAAIEQPNPHNAPHFAPKFGDLINRNPQAIELDVEDWEGTLRPLLDLTDKLLGSSTIDSLKTRYCQECRFFHIIYDILTHFKSLRERKDPDVEKCLKFLEEIISSDNGSHMTSAGVAAEDIPDGSYLEILNRVPDQDFLKTFLGLLVGRCSITSRDSLSKDDAMLMDISGDELGEKLHEMHSILRFEPFIDVHHRSFLDFLQDSSRSGQYHVNRSAGTRRYLELMTNLLIRHARLTNHGNDHFAPEFGKLIQGNPQAIELDVEDWEQTLRPLLNALEKLLVPSNIDSLMDGYCQQCQFFQITYDTLTHLKCLRKREDAVVEKCLKSLEEIILYGNPGDQKFELNFRPVVFGLAAIAGILMAILAHQR